MLAAALASCTGTSQEETPGTKIFEYSDTLDKVLVSVKVELPMGNDSASIVMRENVTTELIDRARYAIYAGEDKPVDVYQGDECDGQALVEFYGKMIKKKLSDMRTEEYDSYRSYRDENPDEESEDIYPTKNDYPEYSTNIDITQMNDSTMDGDVPYVVYCSTIESYWGGAHGSYDANYITMQKDNGFLVSFIEPESAENMQPLIRAGLIEYFNGNDSEINDENLNECLLLEEDDSVIPLPASVPCPSKEGLIFTYCQYEIAPYAAGTPSFTIPYEKLKPYLMEDAKKLLGL